MESIFKEIFEIEKQANEIHDSALNEAKEIENRLCDKAQYEKPYYDGAKERIEKLYKEADRKTNDQLDKIEQQTLLSLESLKESYEKNGDKWVDTLYRNIVERESDE